MFENKLSTRDCSGLRVVRIGASSKFDIPSICKISPAYHSFVSFIMANPLLISRDLFEFDLMTR